MLRTLALSALLCGCTGRALVVPGPGDGSRDFSVDTTRDLAGADLAGVDLAGVDLAGHGPGVDLAGGGGVDMAMVPLPQTHGAQVGTGVTLLAADLDKDGDTDLVVVEATGTVRIYDGDGTGQLFARQAFEINTNTKLATGVLADVDGDGVLDLVLAENGSKSEVDVLRGNGDSTFADWSRTIVAGGVVAVAVGDLNGDSAPDLVAATQDHALHVLQGMQGGKPILLVPTYFVGGPAIQLATTELDGDRKLDLVEIDPSGTSLITGDGAFGFLMNSTVLAPSDPSRFVLGDWNGDGISDVVSAGSSSGMVSLEVVYSDGMAGVEDAHPLGIGIAASSDPVGLATGDLDGDGIADLVVSTDSTPVMVLQYGSVMGGFAGMKTVAIDEGATSIALADFDNDGHLDVAAAGATKTQLYLTTH